MLYPFIIKENQAFFLSEMHTQGGYSSWVFGRYVLMQNLIVRLNINTNFSRKTNPFVYKQDQFRAKFWVKSPEFSKGPIHIPRGWFCFSCWQHNPVVSCTECPPPPPDAHCDVNITSKDIQVCCRCAFCIWLFDFTRFGCAENHTPQDQFRCVKVCYCTHTPQKKGLVKLSVKEKLTRVSVTRRQVGS